MNQTHQVMINLFRKSLVLTTLIFTALGCLQAQSDHLHENSIRQVIIPGQTLNANGHFKSDEQVFGLTETDSLLEKLVLVDENGRMNALGSGGARSILQILHNLNCLTEAGATDPTVFWNTMPGKIYAFSDHCDFTPNVGIGTDTPEARLDVRGTSYFTQNMGLGTLNEGEARLVIRGNGSGILMRSTSGQVDKDVFEVKTNGRIATKGMSASQHALSIHHEGSDAENVIITGDGRTRLRGMSGSAHALEIQSIENETSPNFIIRGNGRISANGMGAQQHALSIQHDESNETNVIITGDGRTRLRGMSSSSNAFEIQNKESLQPNVVFQGNGHFHQNVSGAWNDHVISITDADTENEVFYVQKNGELFIRELGPEFHAITIQNNQSNEHNVIIRSDGRTTLRGMDADANALYIENNEGSESLNVKGNGVMRLNFSGANNNSRVFRIQNENFAGKDVFRITGEGKVWATEVNVRLKEHFPDYVFETDYELMSLEKLRLFIADNQRLPNMPSAEEVDRSGVDLGEMNRLLVEKVEELTLYVLQMEERLKALENTER